MGQFKKNIVFSMKPINYTEISGQTTTINSCTKSVYYTCINNYTIIHVQMIFNRDSHTLTVLLR